MASFSRDLGRWFWRLAPANPILVRVVFAGGRRTAHFWFRLAYLGILAAVVVIGVLVKQSGETSLAGLAKNATQVFNVVAIIQLTMVCILAPLFTAAAITQEKDSQTYNILLSTPLTNGQIVLGSLLSRLFFVFMLLVAAVPLFCIMMVYGGVTGNEIALSSSIAAATALITGSMAIAISVIKIGTGRTIFSFYLAIALYLIVVFALASAPPLIPPEAEPAPNDTARMSWLAPFHPLLALWVVLGKTPAPAAGAVAHYGFPANLLLAYPPYSYIAMTAVVSVMLVAFSLLFVRRGENEGETTLWSRISERLHLSRRRSEQTRAPRHVYENPISWREKVTSASTGGGAMTRIILMGVGLVIALTLLIYYGRSDAAALSAAEARTALFGVVCVELFIALFLATAGAATSMTREKESNTLELLLATPLTSKYVIKGKVMGLVLAAGPLLLVPYLTVILFVVFDLLTRRTFGKEGPVVHAEALITMPVLFVAFTAFACMWGLRQSIGCKKSLPAVFTSMGIVIVFFVIGTACGFGLRGGGSPQLSAAFWPLTPFTATFVIMDPQTALSDFGNPLSGPALESCRIVAFVASLCAAGIYGGFVWTMYRGMVKNFDMVIRQQSA